MWHGKNSRLARRPRSRLQLWIALPPDLENAKPEVQYVGTGGMPIIGPAVSLWGPMQERGARYGRRTGHYLLTTLKPGERWTYEPPLGT